MKDHFICPNCGAEVPSGALACRECGSDDETGWSEIDYIGGLDLPDDEPLDHELQPSTTGAVKQMLVTLVVLLLVLAFVLPIFI
jgi:hypothetical protein